MVISLITITPENAEDKTLIWKTSNSKVAKFEDGKLIAKGIGTATITATLKSNPNIKTTFKVIVETSTYSFEYVLRYVGPN